MNIVFCLHIINFISAIFCSFDFYENMCDINGTTFCDESLRINVAHVDDIETTPAKLSPHNVYFLFSAQFEHDICSDMIHDTSHSGCWMTSHGRKSATSFFNVKSYCS